MWPLQGDLSQPIPYAALQRPHLEMVPTGVPALPPGAALLLNYMERRAPRRARWPDPTFPDFSADRNAGPVCTVLIAMYYKIW
eukprot:SAG31_NODE_2110_length_6426_cov_6.371898_9_plen_83_part_00